MLLKKAPYSLIIETDSDPKEIIKPLISYTFGITSLNSNSESNLYTEAFWKHFTEQKIDNYEDFLEYNIKNKERLLNHFNKNVENLVNTKYLIGQDLKNKIDAIKNNLEEAYDDINIERLYDNYLVNIEINEFETFYYFRDNKIIISFKEMPNQYFYETIINRIKSFFDFNIYTIVSDYECICKNGLVLDKNIHCNLVDIHFIDDKGDTIWIK